jgi:iron complex outermembrane receptor protein
MKQILSTLLLLLLLAPAFAQRGGTISGTIYQENKPAVGATATLLRVRDSSVVRLAAADREGRFTLENIPDGAYLLAATASGHRKTLSAPFKVEGGQGLSLPTLTLLPQASSMGEVTVTARRPLVEQKIDRTVVNVDASITNIGASALEVLEKAPGVSVDRDGNISLKGKDGVLVLVDGRPTQLSGADLTNLLRTMGSGTLDQIEIMTNPPARYDAAGNAGIINIKTKKSLRAGFNGSLNLAYSQGRYPKTNEGVNFNYREGKVNLFTNISHNYQKRFSTLTMSRKIFNPNNGAVDNLFNQEANRVFTGNAFSAKTGIDFFASKKTTLGAVFTFNTRDQVSSNPNRTQISNASKELQSVTRALVDNTNDWNSMSGNLNFRQVLNGKGRELTADLDLVRHRSTGDLFMVNSYTDASGAPLRTSDTLTGFLPQEIRIWSGRVDYFHPLSKDARLEAGFKTSLVRTDNNARYDSILNGATVPDRARSNHFVYEESIHAAYLNLSAPLAKKLSAQLGLRLENTVANGLQKTTGQYFERNYVQLFPTFFLQYKANEKNTFVLNGGRRISRPSYQSLNPFIRFIDRYTFSRGNPSLQPAISTNLELTHTWKNLISTTINYSSVNDIIQEIVQQEGEEAFNMPANVASLKQFGISVTANTPLTKWWTSNVTVNVFHDQYRGFVGAAPIDREATSFILNATQQFKISKTLSGEINGRYRTGWLEGIMRVRPVGFVGAGLSQQLWKGKGNLRLSARDIFFTQRLRGVNQYGNVDFEMQQVAETQVLTIGLTYSFSKGKKIAPVKRTAGSAGEEQGRIGQ